MKLTGHIHDGIPYLAAEVTEVGQLAFRTGRMPQQALVVDTGFEGMLALPEPLINRLDSDPIGHEPFRLADNKLHDLPVYLVPVVVGRKSGMASVIATQALVGMEFLSEWATRLELDLVKETVSVTLKQ